MSLERLSNVKASYAQRKRRLRAGPLQAWTPMAEDDGLIERVRTPLAELPRCPAIPIVIFRIEKNPASISPSRDRQPEDFINRLLKKQWNGWTFGRSTFTL